MAMTRCLFLLLCLWLLSTALALAIDKGLQIFRVGTGPSAGSSYATGVELAGFISKPAVNLSCKQSGLCGVLGLIALTQTQDNFVEAFEAMDEGLIEALLVPADVAYWAYQGSYDFSNSKPYSDLRAFASLKPEYLHIIVRSDRNIESIKDLQNRSISLGWNQSGTPPLAADILQRHGVDFSNSDISPFLYDVDTSLNALASGSIDGAFLMASAGDDSIAQLFRNSPVKLLSLHNHDLLMLQFSPFMDNAEIAAGIYEGSSLVSTIGVNLLWVTKESTSSELIEKIVMSLWNNPNGVNYLQWSDLGKYKRANLYLQQNTMSGLSLHYGAKNYFSKLVRIGSADSS